MKYNDICIIGIPEEEEEREQGIENLFEEIITENFSNLVKENSHNYRKHRVSRLR